MVDFSKYGTPTTPEVTGKNSIDFSKYGTPLTPSGTPVQQPVERGLFRSTVDPSKDSAIGLQALDFLTQGTQNFGRTTGQTIAANKNAELFSQASKQHADIAEALKEEIRKKKLKGENATMLSNSLALHLQDAPKLENFTGDVINKTGEQIFGEGAMMGLEALSGGILEGGAKTAVAKGLTTKSILGQGARVGSIYGAVGGGANAMSENKGLGTVAADAVLGGIAGGALGLGLGVGGVTAGKVASAIDKSALVNKIVPMTEKRLDKIQTWVSDARKSVANVYERSLPLTPTQKIKEANLLTKTGDNVYTTLAKYNINGGSEEAGLQLQKVSDQFRNAINQAKANENNPFNLDEMLINTDKQINDRISSETARAAARKKIEDEVNLLLKNNKNAVSLNDRGQRIVDSSIMERLRDTGNGWTPFNASDPEKVGQSTGYALANAVRDQVEKEGTFPAYRDANREWGKIIHTQEMMQKMADSGKTFRVLGGLSGAISRRVLSGMLGYQTGGIAGAILSELGSEYSARILSNPSLRTYLDRKIIERFADTKATPEAIAKLENEVRAYLEANVERPVLIKPTPKTGTAEMGTYPLRTNDTTGRVEIGSPELNGMNIPGNNSTPSEMGTYKLGKNKTGQVDLTGQYRNPNQNFYNQVEKAPTATPITKQASNITIPESVPSKSKGVNTQGGFVSTGYKETGNLTTKILKKLEGRETVSKQFISDLTNSGDLKQVERDIIRQVLDTEKGTTIDVKQFADKVKQELLPLKVKNTGKNFGITKYEGISLPSDVRGNVKNYKENIYESPIKTSAGSTHFGELSDNYFGHTRIEDMADNKTRRVIEIQSDLYQKGNLEKEVPGIHTVDRPSYEKVMPETDLKKYRQAYEDNKNIAISSPNTSEADKVLVRNARDTIDTLEKKYYPKVVEGRSNEIAKLQQYNDPTAHFRMIREEIAQAAKDGKTKLLFPTGETAMKIEGLGENVDNWVSTEGGRIKPESLKVGMEVGRPGEGYYVVTDVLGDGRFKGISREKVDNTLNSIGVKLDSPSDKLSYLENHHKNTIDYYIETFDISGKVDTSNPIYKFYNKDVSNYLKRFNGKQVIDNKGVSWIEVPVTKDMGGAVEAFGKTNPNILLKGAVVGAGLAGASALMNKGNNQVKTSTPSVTPKGVKIDPEIQKAKDEVSFRETGVVKGYKYNYEKKHPNGSVDIGKYQVNDKTLESYSKKFLGKTISKEDFKKSPALQDKFFEEAYKHLKKLGVKNMDTFLAFWHKGWGDVSKARVALLKKDPEVIKYINNRPK